MGRNSGGVCPFFLQGNCRFGERCWNEHPRYEPGSNRREGWNGYNQRYSNVVQPPNFSKSSNWRDNRDGGSFGFSQNRFASLNASDNVNDGIKDEDEKLVEIIMKDMEIWESSGQWMFSTYSPMKEKPNISGFQDFLPAELRLEYYICRTNNDTQSYISSVQQLLTQWRSRLHELKNINASTKTRLIAELKNVAVQPPPAFGFGVQQQSAFGTSTVPVDKKSSAQTFSFKSPSELGSVTSRSTPAFGGAPAFGSAPAFGGAPAFGNLTSVQGTNVPSAPAHSVGFGNQASSSAASFSFKTTAASDGFGAPGFSNFGKSFPSSSSDTTTTSGFGKVPAAPILDSGNSVFGKAANAFGGHATLTPSVTPVTISSEKLFTPKNELSEEELKQFEAKKFSLGKIPLKPPPLELLSM